MAHYRQTIRDAVAAVLKDNTEAGANVFTSRARPVLEILQKGQAVLSIYTSDESSNMDGDGYLLDRTLTISIEGMAGGGDDLDDILDDLCAEVEALIDADPMLGAVLSSEMVLTTTTSEITARGNQQIGAFKLDYECGYKTDRQRTGYMPGDAPDFVIPTPPIPSLVTVSGEATPIAYVAPLTDAVVDDAPATQDDALRLLDTDTALQQAQPAAPTESVCDDETGCDLTAWAGDK